jgi:hypothetical protein
LETLAMPEPFLASFSHIPGLPGGCSARHASSAAASAKARMGSPLLVSLTGTLYRLARRSAKSA